MDEGARVFDEDVPCGHIRKVRLCERPDRRVYLDHVGVDPAQSHGLWQRSGAQPYLQHASGPGARKMQRLQHMGVEEHADSARTRPDYGMVGA